MVFSLFLHHTQKDFYTIYIYSLYSEVKSTMYTGKMVSMRIDHARWLAQKGVSLSTFVRDACEIAIENDTGQIKESFRRLQRANNKLNELIADYENDRSVRKEDIVCN